MTTVASKLLKARDIMVDEPVCVDQSTTIRELGRVFEENEISGAPVVDKTGRVVGIVSKTDLIRRCSEGSGDIPPAYLFEALREESDDDSEVVPEPLICVEDIMTNDPVTVALETAVQEVARIMHAGRFHRVVVVDKERFPIGIITSLDLVGVVARKSPKSRRVV